MPNKNPKAAALGNEGAGEKTPANRVEQAENIIGSILSNRVLRSGKLDKAYEQAINTPNPMAPLALLISQTVLSTREKMIQKKLLSSDKIWAAEDGVVDNIVFATDPPWERAGIHAVPEELKSEVFKLLAKFDEAGTQAKVKPAPASAGALGAPQQPQQAMQQPQVPGSTGPTPMPLEQPQGSY